MRIVGFGLCQIETRLKAVFLAFNVQLKCREWSRSSVSFLEFRFKNIEDVVEISLDVVFQVPIIVKENK